MNETQLKILTLQNRVAKLRARTEKDNKGIQNKCLRKIKNLQK